MRPTSAAERAVVNLGILASLLILVILGIWLHNGTRFQMCQDDACPCHRPPEE